MKEKHHLNQGTAFRAGVELFSGLLVGLGIGWGLDHVFETFPLFLIIFFVLGFVVGLLNVLRSLGMIEHKTKD